MTSKEEMEKAIATVRDYCLGTLLEEEGMTQDAQQLSKCILRALINID